jgi:hypothetical protein
MSTTHMKEGRKVDAVVVGPDAKDTPWTIHSQDTVHHPLEMGGTKVMKRKRGDSASSKSKANSSKASTVPETLPPPIRQTRGGPQLTSSTKPQLPSRMTRQTIKKKKRGDLPGVRSFVCYVIYPAYDATAGSSFCRPKLENHRVYRTRAFTATTGIFSRGSCFFNENGKRKGGD